MPINNRKWSWITLAHVNYSFPTVLDNFNFSEFVVQLQLKLWYLSINSFSVLRLALVFGKWWMISQIWLHIYVDNIYRKCEVVTWLCNFLHVHLWSLFNKHVLIVSPQLHDGLTWILLYIYYVNGSIDPSSRNFNTVNCYSFDPKYVLFKGCKRWFYQQEFLMGITFTCYR